MSAKPKLVAAFVVTAAVLLLTGLPLRLELLQPRLAQPAITLAGATLPVRIKQSLPLGFGDWRLSLQAESGETVVLPIASRTLGFGSTELRIRLPDSLEAGGYTLQVDYAGAQIREPKAVHVIAAAKSDIRIIQLADLPTLGNDARVGGDGQGDLRLGTIIKEINLINPDVVLFTGDLAYGGSWDQYQRLREGLSQVRAPVIAVPGNHEYYGWAGYLTLFGQPYHSVRYGDFQVLSLNSGHGRDQMTQSQLAWLQRCLDAAPEATNIIQLHHPIHQQANLTGNLRGNTETLLRTIKQAHPAVVLSGHWHGDSVYDETGKARIDAGRFQGTPFVVTTTAGADLRPDYSRSPLHYGYRLLRFQGRELQNFTYDYDGDGERDASSSIPVGKLNIQRQGLNGVLIQNALNEGFTDALVEIDIADVSHEYRPKSGRLHSIIRGPTATRYRVLLDLPAQRDSIVEMISP